MMMMMIMIKGRSTPGSITSATPRSSNEARQTLFMKLSGELRRRIGLKVLEIGGNSVIGYIQCFDLEGESCIVVRGIGIVAFLNMIWAPMACPMAMSSSVWDFSRERSYSAVATHTQAKVEKQKEPVD